jgi:hypothetical protein
MDGRSITEIDQTLSWQEAVSQTVDAFRRGVHAIYCPTAYRLCPLEIRLFSTAPMGHELGQSGGAVQ